MTTAGFLVPAGATPAFTREPLGSEFAKMCLCRLRRILLALAPFVPLAAQSEGSLAEQIEREIKALHLSEPKRVVRLSCPEAIAKALEGNFDIRIYRRMSAQDQARFEAARARFDPYFLTSANVRKYRYPTVRILDVGGTPVSDVEVNPGMNRQLSTGFHGLLQTGTTWSLTLQGQREDTPRSAWYGINPRQTILVNLTLTQPLLKGGWLPFNMADVRIAANDAALGRALYEEQVAEVVAETEKAYWDLVYTVKKVRVQEEAYREARTFLALTQERRAVGYKASELDVISARTQVETLKSELVTAYSQLLAARDALLLRMNPTSERTFLEARRGAVGEARFKIEDIYVEPTSEPVFESIEVNIEEALDRAFRRRPLYLTYKLKEKNQQVEIERRRNELLPRLDLVAEWNQHGLEKTLSDAFSELGSGKYYSWYLGAQFELPLFNRAARARLREAEEMLWQLSFERKKFENSLVADIVKAVRELRSTTWQVRSTRTAAELARKQLEGEKKRLESGTTTSYTVLQMQNDLLDAQLKALKAAVAYKTALVNLKRAEGTLLDEYDIQVR